MNSMYSSMNVYVGIKSQFLLEHPTSIEFTVEPMHENANIKKIAIKLEHFVACSQELRVPYAPEAYQGIRILRRCLDKFTGDHPARYLYLEVGTDKESIRDTKCFKGTYFSDPLSLKVKAYFHHQIAEMMCKWRGGCGILIDPHLIDVTFTPEEGEPIPIYSLALERHEVWLQSGIDNTHWHSNLRWAVCKFNPRVYDLSLTNKYRVTGNVYVGFSHSPTFIPDVLNRAYFTVMNPYNIWPICDIRLKAFGPLDSTTATNSCRRYKEICSYRRYIDKIPYFEVLLSERWRNEKLYYTNEETISGKKYTILNAEFESEWNYFSYVALESFLYTEALDYPRRNTTVAIDLLIMANQFLYAPLEDKLIDLLLVLPDQSFDDIAHLLKLYLFLDYSRISLVLLERVSEIMKGRAGEILKSSAFDDLMGSVSNMGIEVALFLGLHCYWVTPHFGNLPVF